MGMSSTKLIVFKMNLKLSECQKDQKETNFIETNIIRLKVCRISTGSKVKSTANICTASGTKSKMKYLSSYTMQISMKQNFKRILYWESTRNKTQWRAKSSTTRIQYFR